MLTEKEYSDYAKELEVQQLRAQSALAEAKTAVKHAEANLNAVVGARQAVAHILALNAAKAKEVTK